MQNFTARVTADAVVATTKDGRQVVNFNVVINDYYRTKAGEAKTVTEYFQCSYWISTGVAKVLKKGTLVELYARIGKNAWLGSDGEAKASLLLHTSNIKILGRAATQSENSPVQLGTEPASSKDESDDLPF